MRKYRLHMVSKHEGIPVHFSFSLEAPSMESAIEVAKLAFIDQANSMQITSPTQVEVTAIGIEAQAAE